MKSFPPFGFGIATLTASVALVVAPSCASARESTTPVMPMRSVAAPFDFGTWYTTTDDFTRTFAPTPSAARATTAARAGGRATARARGAREDDANIAARGAKCGRRGEVESYDATGCVLKRIDSMRRSVGRRDGHASASSRSARSVWSRSDIASAARSSASSSSSAVAVAASAISALGR